MRSVIRVWTTWFCRSADQSLASLWWRGRSPCVWGVPATDIAAEWTLFMSLY
jgi:hypothetical protein